MPYARVLVTGPSMAPSLRNGDWVLVRLTTRLRPGDVAVMVHPHRPDLRIIKRLVRREPDGWWVLGDHAGASDDSRQFGPVPDECMIGRVTVRYKPLRRS
jgi:nickel-type superoxide dismutase maturation protease